MLFAVAEMLPLVGKAGKGCERLRKEDNLKNNTSSSGGGFLNSAHQGKIPLIIIAGPTAVGKSRVAMEIAPLIRGEIVAADSAQVYRYMNIGTAKATPEEQKQVPHHLIDITEPDRQFTVADYQEKADAAIKDIFNRNKIPVMVGGTGLYIEAVADRYAFRSRGSHPELRKKLEKEAEEQGFAALYQKLKEADPVSAEKIHPRNVRRVIRALEVYYGEGEQISRQWADTAKRDNPYHIFRAALNMPREELYRIIEERTDMMMAAGFLAEVRALMNNYPPDAPGLQILGYRQLTGYIRGIITLDEAIISIKKETRNLAKKQITWFKRDKRINWLDLTGGDLSPAAEKLFNQIK